MKLSSKPNIEYISYSKCRCIVSSLLLWGRLPLTFIPTWLLVLYKYIGQVCSLNRVWGKFIYFWRLASKAFATLSIWICTLSLVILNNYKSMCNWVQIFYYEHHPLISKYQISKFCNLLILSRPVNRSLRHNTYCVEFMIRFKTSWWINSGNLKICLSYDKTQ